MPFQFVYPTNRKATLPGARGQSLADQFHPGEFLVKQSEPQKKTQPVKQPPAQQQKSTSLLTKIKTGAKGVAKAATAGEQKFAEGIVRTLPGGTADIQAEKQASDQASRNMQLVKSQVKNKTQANKIIKSTASDITQAGKNTTDIYKKLPNKKQIALGAASTAADIVTAGQLPMLKAAKGSSVLSKTIRHGTDAGAWGTAGALNSAADGGNKKQIAENFVAGATLPGVLHVAGKGVVASTKAVDKHVLKPIDDRTQQALDNVMNKVRAPKSLLEKVKTQSLLDAATQKEAAKAAIEAPKIEQKIELINAKKADGKFTNVDKVKVRQLEDQKKALGIPTASTPDTKAPVANTKVSDQQFAHDYFANNRPKAEADYANRTKDEFGVTKNNVVSGDEAKFIIPKFGPQKSVPYHEAASTFAKEHYKTLLADETTKDRPVMIMAGGSGAGKTTALRHVMDGKNNALDGFAAVVDTNLTDMAGAESRIKAARDTGRPVEINYVYRDPKEAYANGVIPRANRTGRVVTDKIHAETHTGSLDTVKQLIDKYKEDPNVNINVIDNSRGAGKQTIVPESKVLDFLNKKSYNKEQIHTDVHTALDDAVKTKQLTEVQRNDFIHKEDLREQRPRQENNAAPDQKLTQGDQKPAKISARKEAEYKPAKGEPVNVAYEQPKIKQPEIGKSKLASSTEQKAIDKKLTQGFEGKPEYAKVNTKDQASAASELLKSDPEKSIRIALGQELPPEHLLPESVYIAVENKALKEGNVDLLRKLATEGSLSSEATGMGQRIRMLGERDPDSAVSAMRKLAEARAKAYEKRTGKTTNKVVSDEIKQIRAAKPKIVKETFASFVDSLKC